MQTDKYTKVVLTIIAVCLTVNTVQKLDLIPSAYANEANDALPDIEAPRYGLVPLNQDGLIDVNIKDISTYDELNVNLKGVDTYEKVPVTIKGVDTSDELDVNLDELGGSWISSGGPLKVQIQN
ncbi:MAG: hypothetical protein ABJM06_02500 [Gilvibacter sp.]